MKIVEILERFTVPHLVRSLAVQRRKARGTSEDKAEENSCEREELVGHPTGGEQRPHTCIESIVPAFMPTVRRGTARQALLALDESVPELVVKLLLPLASIISPIPLGIAPSIPRIVLASRGCVDRLLGLNANDVRPLRAVVLRSEEIAVAMYIFLARVKQIDRLHLIELGGFPARRF